MEYAGTSLQVNSLILHGPRIATTSSIHGPRVCPYLRGQGQYGVVSIVGRVLHTFFLLLRLSRNMLLHALRHFDTQQSHGVLDNLGHVLGQHQTDGLLLLVRLVEDREIVVELVEHLGQLVAVVGNA